MEENGKNDEPRKRCHMKKEWKKRPPPANFYDNLRNNIKIPVERSVANHIWNRHGCYSNAKFEKKKKKNKGKMPSYFINQTKMEKSIISTVNRPNWTRACYPGKTGFKTGSIGRFRGRNYRKNLKKFDNNQKNDVKRKFYFKSFTTQVGISGQGYGKKPGTDNKECFCCCAVVQPVVGLITAYPILTEEANDHGVGPKESIHEETSTLSSISDKDYKSMCECSEGSAKEYMLQSARSSSENDSCKCDDKNKDNT